MKAYVATICGGFVTVTAILAMSGCTGDGRPTIIPNSDSSLRKSSTELAADAAKRSYEIDAPKSHDSIARAQYNVMERQFEVANLSNSDWQNIEVWVNQRYVVCVPQFDRNTGKTLNFELFYDAEGHHFETDHGNNPVRSLQIYQGGKMYDVVATLQ
ncbi:MAG: hypothetical protein ABSB42_07475 [Tepidisphaeraceae bacterium]|jgi:hypothetical protein